MSYDDDYDDDPYDDPDDTSAYHDPRNIRPAGVPPDPDGGQYIGDAETLLRRAVDIIATAPNMPLSSTPRIDREEIIELLDEALHRLPDELRQARWMLKERQEFVSKTRREADELLEAARVQAERMVQRTEVVRAAEQRARQILDAAETDSRRIRHETEDFLDQRLGSFEILLDKLAKTVATGRNRLSIGMHQHDDATERHCRRRDREGLLRSGPALMRLLVNTAELRHAVGSEKSIEGEVDPAEIGIDDDAPRGRVADHGRSAPRERERRGPRDRHGRRPAGQESAGAAWNLPPTQRGAMVDERYQYAVTDPDAFPIDNDHLEPRAAGARGGAARVARRTAVPARLRRSVRTSAARTAMRGTCGCSDRAGRSPLGRARRRCDGRSSPDRCSG